MAVESSLTIQHLHTPDSPSTYSTPPRNRCCFNFPCFGPAPVPTLTLGRNPSSTSSLWDRIRVGQSHNKWWARPITTFKKVREWSEIVAGPKWKTFIRRFNRNNRHGHGHGHGHGGKFQYDPLSYALNFDEGQNGHFDEEGLVENYPDFSARFARTSVDFGQGAPAS